MIDQTKVLKKFIMHDKCRYFSAIVIEQYFSRDLGLIIFSVVLAKSTPKCCILDQNPLLFLMKSLSKKVNDMGQM